MEIRVYCTFTLEEVGTLIADEATGFAHVVEGAPRLRDALENDCGSAFTTWRGGSEVVVLPTQDDFDPAVEGRLEVYDLCTASRAGELRQEREMLAHEGATLRPGRSRLRFEMRPNGWIFLHIGVGEQTIKIYLSEVFDPLPAIIEWARQVDDGVLPASVEIDEEGTSKTVTVFPTERGDRWVVQVRRDSCGLVFFQNAVHAIDFTTTLKHELWRFFTREFDAEGWDERHGPGEGRDVKKRVLEHPWMIAVAASLA